MNKIIIKQSSVLYLSMIINMGLGFIVSMINTHFLGAQDFGQLKYIQAILNALILLLTFGLFNTGSRIVALCRDSDKKRVYFFSFFIISLVISILCGTLLYTLAPVQDIIFNNATSYFIRLSIPLCACMIFTTCLTGLFQGNNNIYSLAILRVSPSILYITASWLINQYFLFSLEYGLLIQAASMFLPLLIFVYLSNPKPSGASKATIEILTENKGFGVHVYIGSIFGVGSTYLTGVIIAYYLEMKDVGFYGLAVTLCAPLQMIANVIGTSFFKEFTQAKYLPARLNWFVLASSALALIIFLTIVPWVVDVLYGPNFIKVSKISSIMAYGYTLYGMADYINRFVGAHGRGKLLRNSAILVGLLNIIGFIILAQYFGLDGAAITVILSGLAYFLSMVVSYTIVRNEIKTNLAIGACF